MTSGEGFLCLEGKRTGEGAAPLETGGFHVKISTMHPPDAVEGLGCA